MSNLVVMPTNQSTPPERARPMRIKPKIELAIRMYASGQIVSVGEAAKVAGCAENWFSTVLNSDAGQAIVNSVRSELDFKYKALYSKFIQVVSDALNHVDPAVALAGANLYAKTSVGTKHKVELSAEDIVQKILEGSYTEDGA